MAEIHEKPRNVRKFKKMEAKKMQKKANKPENGPESKKRGLKKSFFMGKGQKVCFFSKKWPEWPKSGHPGQKRPPEWGFGGV